LFHGGEEWTHKPNRATRELYTSFIREGADLIIGSHPHIVQGFEWIDDKLIFWSLGNYVFSGMENTGGGDEGLLIRLGYHGKKPLYIEPFALNLSGPKVNLSLDQKLETFYRRSIELLIINN
jgi:poly-gamma-glutamate synthesis protein (capsule biosynthesis protein)